MKRFLSILMILIILCACAACTKEDDNGYNPSFEVSKGELSASTYVTDSWKMEKEDGTRDYFLSLFLHSDTYYAFLNESCVKFLDNGEYKLLTDVFADAEITLYDFNDTKTGTSAFALIKTNKMIDSKKVYVLMDGPAKYEEDVKSKEDFTKKHGAEPTKSEWATSLCSYSEKTSPVKNIVFNHDNSGIFGFFEEENFYYYYQQTGDFVVSGDKAYANFTITPLTEATNEQIETVAAPYFFAANINDGTISQADEIENIEIYYHYENNVISVGYKTSNGQNIQTYIKNLPEYIAFAGNLSQEMCFAVLDK